MATGYSESGVAALRCVGPPDAGAGASGGDFVPTAFLGMYPNYSTYGVQYALGINDFSYECWFRWAMGNADATTDLIAYLVGFLQDDGAGFFDPVAVSYPSLATYSLGLDYDTTPGGALVATTGYDAIPGAERGWMHLAVNFDRSGNMAYYVDTTLVDQVAIDANTLATRRFYPLTVNQGGDNTDAADALIVNGGGATTAFSLATVGCARMLQGPVALHNRLLTAAEIRDSFQSHYVQNIAGVTQILWDWREITGHSGWDYDQTHLLNRHRTAIIGDYRAGIPLGANGVVTIPDLSGNGNALTLPTAASYGTTAGTLAAGHKAWCGFLADPWWT